VRVGPAATAALAARVEKVVPEALPAGRPGVPGKVGPAAAAAMGAPEVGAEVAAAARHWVLPLSPVPWGPTQATTSSRYRRMNRAGGREGRGA